MSEGRSGSLLLCLPSSWSDRKIPGSEDVWVEDRSKEGMYVRGRTFVSGRATKSSVVVVHCTTFQSVLWNIVSCVTTPRPK